MLTFSVTDGIDPCTIAGYIVGFSQLKVQHSTGKEYYVTNVPAGSRDLIVTASGLPASGTLALESPDRGIRIGKAVVLNGVATPISGVLDIPLLGSLAGKVSVAGQSDFSGVQVNIPGTTYIAVTDLNGNYTMGDVPSARSSAAATEPKRIYPLSSLLSLARGLWQLIRA